MTYLKYRQNLNILEIPKSITKFKSDKNFGAKYDILFSLNFIYHFEHNFQAFFILFFFKLVYMNF
jgi:hypothetical protein